MFNDGYGSIPKLHFSACSNNNGEVYASCSTGMTRLITMAPCPSNTLVHAVSGCT